MSEPDSKTCETEPKDAAKAQEIECPECHTHFGVEMVARFAPQTRTVMRLKAKDGRILTTDDVGGAIVNYGKLLKSISKELGGNVIVAVESIALKDSELTVTFMVVEVEKGRKS